MILTKPEKVWAEMLYNPNQEITIWEDEHYQIVACDDEITALHDGVPIYSEQVIGSVDCTQIVQLFLRRFTDWFDDEPEDADEPNDADEQDEREQELYDATEDFLRIILDEDADPETIRDVMEHTLSFLAKVGYSIYRPMWLKTSGGEFWTDHPYTHLIV